MASEEVGEIRLLITDVMKEKGLIISKCCKDLDMDRETFLRYSRDTIQRLDKGILCRLLAYFEVGISDLISYERKDVVK